MNGAGKKEFCNCVTLYTDYDDFIVVNVLRNNTVFVVGVWGL